MGVRLFVGGHIGTIQGERPMIEGDWCFTAVHPPPKWVQPEKTIGLLDSGAFSDPPDKRLTPDGALDRQLEWEQRASRIWGQEWRSSYIVSYDLLIDETWVAGERHKRRWSVAEAEAAVRETVRAAYYLASQRDRLRPRTLVLSAQGVDHGQYTECVSEILRVATPGDWLGLGGWCILGLYKRWMPEFRATIRRVIPMAAAAGVRHVHIFGVTYEPALGTLLHIADEHGITVSADSTRPILNCKMGKTDPKKAGVRRPYWRDNVRYWRDQLANLRATPHYRPPVEQLTLGIA